MNRLCDWTGIVVLKRHMHVKVVNPRHAYFGRSGTVIRIQAPHVWVALPGGVVAKASHRSIEAL